MSRADAPAFTPAAYLRDRLPSCILIVACAILVCGMCVVLGTSRDGAVLVGVFVVAMASIALTIGYGRRRRFWDQAAGAAESMDDPSQLKVFVEEPAFLEGKLAFSLADRVEELANIELTAAQDEAEAYRSYIELWIHEAKTPIAAAKLAAARLGGQDADMLALELERIEVQVEQALYYARSTAVANDYAIREVPLAEAAREACKRHARFLIEHQTIPDIGIPEDVTVLADRPWLVFILGQLIVNAAQYGAHRIAFTCSEEDVGTSRERTVLCIADDGCGIPPEDVPRVFDRGFTGKNGRQSGTATGMGLHLVARLCMRLGLGVALASEEGSGTRVSIDFPHDRRRGIRDEDVRQM